MLFLPSEVNQGNKGNKGEIAAKILISACARKTEEGTTRTRRLSFSGMTAVQRSVPASRKPA